MFTPESRDVLIECRGCGAENSFSSYTPESKTLCSECREPLIDADLNDHYHEYICETCGYTMLLLKDTPFQLGKARCKCGSKDIAKMDTSTIAEEAEEAGLLHETPVAGDDDGEDDEDDDPDWLHPEDEDGEPPEESDDYDESPNGDRDY